MTTPKPRNESKRCARWRVLAQDGARKVDMSVEGTEFDELVVGEWLHIERMDTRDWWMGVRTPSGDVVHINFRVGRDGRATVTVTDCESLVRGINRGAP